MRVVRRGRPGLTTIGRPQQSSAFTDHPAFFVVAKVDVIKRACGSGVLFDPCLAGVKARSNSVDEKEAGSCSERDCRTNQEFGADDPRRTSEQAP